ncbi:MAG: hypothetical protein MI861_27610, partial [Pirellulales bacterium]|nr:hypothetical protein [Pirellulales bacterium]
MSIFLVCVLHPLATSTLTIVSIGPPPSKPAGMANRTTLSAAASSSLDHFHRLAKQIPTARVEPRSTLGDALSNSRRSWLGQHRTAQQPLLVHAVGSAMIDRQRALLLPRYADTPVRPRALDVCRLLRQAATADSPTVVIIDLLDSEQLPIGRLPEMTAWQFERVIDETLASLPPAQLLVVIAHSQVEEVEVERTSTFVSPLTHRLAAGFQADSDSNHDRRITVGELLHTITAIDKKHRGPAPKVFSTLPLAQWRQVALTPTLPDTGDKLAASKPPAGSQSQAKIDRPVADSIEASGDSETKSDQQIELPVTAPTLAIAAGLLEFGTRTRRSSECLAIGQQLERLLAPEALEKAASDWLKTPAVASVSWDEVNWARTVLDSKVDWPLKQDLIRCRMLANQLAAEPMAPQWFPESWKAAQWARLDAERSLTSPVRHDHADHVRRRVREAIRQYRTLKKRTQLVINAHALGDEIRLRTPELVASPIRARSPHDDVICQLLRDTIALDQWLRQGHGESIGELEKLTESIHDRRAAAYSAMEMSEEMLDPPSATLPVASAGPDDHCAKLTRVRILRSSLAMELRTNSAPDSTRNTFRRASQHARDVLANSSSSAEQIDQALAAFRQAIVALASSVETQPPIPSDRQRSLQMLHRVAADTETYATDATDDQRDRLSQVSDRCRRLAIALGETIVAYPAADFRIEVIRRGSLAESDKVSLDIVVHRLTETTLSGDLEIEIDPETVIVESSTAEPSLSVRHVTDRGYRPRATQHPSSGPQRLSASPHHRASVTLGRASNAVFDQAAVNVRWVTGKGVYRSSVPLEMPLPPLTRVRFGNKVGGQASETWIMHANGNQFRRLVLEPLNKETRQLQVRLLAWRHPGVSAPPTLTKTRAERWLSRQVQPTVLASHPGLAVKFGTEAEVLFKPQPVDPHSPPQPIGSLLCEVTDTDHQLVQWIDISPRVYRPSSLVQPSIAFNHVAQIVTVQLNDPAAIDGVNHARSEPTRVRVELAEKTGQVTARGDMLAVPGTRLSKRYSSAGIRGDQIHLRIHVDGWPNAFVYRWPANRSATSLSPVDDWDALAIVHPTKEIVANNRTPSISATVAVDVTDHVFRYGKDTITLGLDLNGDRYLHDEPSVAVNTPVAIGFTWAGVDDQGSIGLQSRVAPHQLRVPTGMVRNRRAQLVARLQRGESTSWSLPASVVFDGIPPRIEAVQIVSSLPALLGAPISAKVKMDDGGLSGAAALQAGWATAGQQEFTPDVKPVAGQLLDNGQWMVNVPTDGLVPGKHQLLLQPTDAAGNVG